MTDDGKIKIILEFKNLILNFTGGGLTIIRKENTEEHTDVKGMLELDDHEAVEFRMLWDAGIAAVNSIYHGGVSAPVFHFPINPHHVIHTRDEDEDED